MAEHVNPKLSILVDKSDGKKVYAATHSDGVVIEDDLWGKTDWESESGKLRLTKVLEEIPNLVDNSVSSLELVVGTDYNGASTLGLLKNGHYLGKPITLPNNENNLPLIRVGNTVGAENNFLVNSLNTDAAIPTGKAVYVAIDKTLGYVINEIDRL